MQWLFQLKWLFDSLKPLLGSPPKIIRLIIATVFLVVAMVLSLMGRLPVLVFPAAIILLLYLIAGYYVQAVYYANKFGTRIIVRLDPWVQLDGKRARHLLPRIPGGRVTFLFNEKTLVIIDRLIRRALEHDLSYRPPDFRRMLVVRLKPNIGPDAAIRILKDASGTHGVRMAYVDPYAAPAKITPESNPKFNDQRYLNAATAGIDAHYAWTMPGGAGEGVSVVDLEEAWTLTSPDLSRGGTSLISRNLTEISGGPDPTHGEQVLGILMAQNNTLSCIGIAHLLASAYIAGYHFGNGSEERPAAIMAAADELAFGDVLCMPIHLQSGAAWMPIEAAPNDFEAIRLATAAGIVVVEAAGNGQKDLDLRKGDPDRPATEVTLDRDDAAFVDSGAIVVGGGTTLSQGSGSFMNQPPLSDPGYDQHHRRPSSNFGSRVDVYAWGEKVVSIPAAFFDGTSAATPIIAGAAMSVQGVSRNLGSSLSPLQMRSLLSFGGTETVPNTEKIGVMPNLRTICNYLACRPAAFIRDALGDEGVAHELRDCFDSPDIFIRSQATAADQLDVTIEEPLVLGQNQFVYLRFGNSGDAPGNIKAQLFELSATTIPTPADFTFVNKVALDIPANGEWTVSPSIQWTPSATAHGLMAISDAPDNPAVAPSYFAVRRNSAAILRRHSNIARRSMRTMFNTPSALNDNPVLPIALALEFTAPAVETDEFFSDGFIHLDIGHDLPETVPVWLEGPLEFIEAAAKVQQTEESTLRGWCQLFGSRTLKSVQWKPNAPSLKLRLLVQCSGPDLESSYRIQVRQLNGTEVVGHLGWNLVPQPPVVP